MSVVERHPPHWQTVARRQFGLLTSAPHPELIPLAIASFFLFLGGVSFQLTLPGVTSVHAGPALAYLFSLVVASNWAGAAWPGEGPSQRDYHQVMPVDRRAHDLLRVGAGAAWLLLVLATLVVFGAVLAYTRDPGDTGGFLNPVFLIQFLIGPLAVFLLGSAAAIASDHPGRLITAGWMLSLVLWLISAIRHWTPVQALMSALFLGPLRMSFPGGDDPAQAPGAILVLGVWLALGLAVVTLAAGKRKTS